MTLLAICFGEPLGRELSDLRCVEADPDQSCIGIGLPVVEELLEIAVTAHLLPRDGAVDRDLMPFDVLEDPIVGGRRAPDVVFGLEAIDRHDDLQPVQSTATRLGIGRTALVTSCVCTPRCASCGRIALSSLYLTSGSPPTIDTCSGLVAIDERHETGDELVALVVGEPAQRDVAAKMLVAVGVAARTAQRTLLGDLDREFRTIARENTAPSLDDFLDSDAGCAHVATIMIYSS